MSFWLKKSISVSLRLMLLFTVASSLKAAGDIPAVSVGASQGNYSWSAQQQLPNPGNGVLYFTAQANSDITIGFSPTPSTQDPMYEIVLGGWGNTQSVIRTQSQGQPVATVNPSSPCNPQGQAYWVQLDASSNTISVGTGLVAGENAFIQYIDPNFLTNAAYFGFSSWDTPIAYSNISVGLTAAQLAAQAQALAAQQEAAAQVAALQQPAGGIPAVSVGASQGNYSWSAQQQLPNPGNGVLYFTAQANSDITIGFSPTPSVQNPMYEIVLGGWGNTQSVIRTQSQGQPVATANPSSPCNPQGQAYWIQLDASSNTISAGMGSVNGQNVIIQYTDPNFLTNAAYFGFSSWDTPIAYSNISVGLTAAQLASQSQVVQQQPVAQPAPTQTVSQQDVLPAQAPAQQASVQPVATTGVSIQSINDQVAAVKAMVTAAQNQLSQAQAAVTSGQQTSDANAFLAAAQQALSDAQAAEQVVNNLVAAQQAITQSTGDALTTANNNFSTAQSAVATAIATAMNSNQAVQKAMIKIAADQAAAQQQTTDVAAQAAAVVAQQALNNAQAAAAATTAAQQAFEVQQEAVASAVTPQQQATASAALQVAKQNAAAADAAQQAAIAAAQQAAQQAAAAQQASDEAQAQVIAQQAATAQAAAVAAQLSNDTAAQAAAVAAQQAADQAAAQLAAKQAAQHEATAVAAQATASAQSTEKSLIAAMVEQAGKEAHVKSLKARITTAAALFAQKSLENQIAAQALAVVQHASNITAPVQPTVASIEQSSIALRLATVSAAIAQAQADSAMRDLVNLIAQNAKAAEALGKAQATTQKHKTSLPKKHKNKKGAITQATPSTESISAPTTKAIKHKKKSGKKKHKNKKEAITQATPSTEPASAPTTKAIKHKKKSGKKKHKKVVTN